MAKIPKISLVGSIASIGGYRDTSWLHILATEDKEIQGRKKNKKSFNSKRLRLQWQLQLI